MRLVVEIQMDNAAFEGDPIGEVEKILADVVKKMRGRKASDALFDSNGNRVGRFTVGRG